MPPLQWLGFRTGRVGGGSLIEEGDLLWLCPAHHKELTGTPFGESYTRQTKPAHSK